MEQSLDLRGEVSDSVESFNDENVCEEARRLQRGEGGERRVSERSATCATCATANENSCHNNSNSNARKIWERFACIFKWILIVNPHDEINFFAYNLNEEYNYCDFSIRDAIRTHSFDRYNLKPAHISNIRLVTFALVRTNFQSNTFRFCMH